jgi:TonB dependent receptor-like, beta-barrel/CarboxypepD_reg-like domain/TonB-dependent Receptor Plug Domain
MKYILSILFLFSTFSFAQSSEVKGKVTDGSNPLSYVNITVINTRFGAVSDGEGYYEINGLLPGTYQLRFSSVGYKTDTNNVQIKNGETLELNVLLKPISIELGDVEVTGSKRQDQKDTRTSLIDLNPRSAKVLPGAGEDVLRTLQSLPGVLAPNDFSSQLIIRGSGADQNLIIMDDIEIFNPYRLYGVISMFNPDAVSDVNLITGGFPAKYGDRLSAVLDVTNREGTTKKNIKGSVNASIVDANLVLEGKNPFNLNGSWLISSRRTYYDLIVEPFVKNSGLVDQNVSFPNFYDVQSKLVVGPYNGHKILFNGIFSRDGVDLVSAQNRKTADSIGVYNSTKNSVLGLAWHYSPNPRFLNKFIISWYKNNGLTDFASEILDPSLNRDKFKDAVPDTLSPYLLGFKFNADFSFRKFSYDDKFTYLWKNNTFEAGAGMDNMQTIVDFKFQLDPELEAIIAANPQFRAVLSDIKDVKNYNRYRAYAQNNFSITGKLFFQPGLRFDYYNILEKAYLAPRISLSYAIDDITTVRANWGIYYQSPGYEKLLDSGILYDLSKEYTTKLDAEKAIHYVLGIDRWLNNEWNLKFEGYYKDFSNLIIQKTVQGSNYYTEPVPGKDPRFSSGWTRPVTNFGDSLTQIPVNESHGDAYGLELFLSKKNILNSGKFSGWISYSLAFANTFENGKEYPFRFDQRNTFNIVFNYQLNDWLNLGVRWQYDSGFPISQPVGIKPRIILQDNNLDGIPETPVIATRNTGSNGSPEVIYDIDYGGNKLNGRKPPYHRLDIRLTALADYWDLDWSFYLDVINVYNRANVIGYDYFVTDDLKLGSTPNNMFPIIPTLGFSVKF